MNIRIVCIGKFKERYWTEAAAEYSKRLSRYCTLTVQELKEERLCDNASPEQEKAVIVAEGKAILKALVPGSYVVALAINGKSLSSEGLADTISNLALEGKSDITFIIGGSLGLSDDVLKAADMRLSFSAMTFPHQMMRIILMEQIYRAFRIIRNEPYHK